MRWTSDSHAQAYVSVHTGSTPWRLLAWPSALRPPFSFAIRLALYSFVSIFS